MAVIGKSNISRIRTLQEEVLNPICNGTWDNDESFAGQLNTFNYVLNSLDEWASETNIGENISDNIRAINTGIEAVSEHMRNINMRLSAFIDRQESLDRGHKSGPIYLSK